MDTWKFYDITHRRHVVCNPTSEEKLARLVDLVQLPTGARVVDIACGKGEFLIRLVEAYGVRGVGVDLSPFFIAEAERRLRARVPQAAVTFTQMDGARFKPDKPNSLTLASCIGASWVFGGHAQDSRRAGGHGRTRRLGDRGGAVLVAGAVGRALAGVWANKRCLRKPRGKR